MSCHKVLQAQGYRLTPQRMLIIGALHNADSHISAEEIYEQLHSRYPYSNISTVYRTLELLKKLDLVTETDFGEGRVRYHVAEKSHHHHLVCHKCGKVIDLPESVLYPLRDALLRNYDFEADLRHLAISGECSDCRKGAREATLVVSDIQEKLRIMLDYWVQHNREHEKEFCDWAGKAASLSTEASQQLKEAATRMADASKDLEKARQALMERKEEHQDVHG